MNIEIDYNPAIPYTSLKKNANTDDDMFGALYQVRRYPLQSWLKKNGAWNGLPKVLRDVTRGRQFTLTFTGRGMDYEDLITALADINAEFLHISAYENEEENKFIDDILGELKFISDYPNKEIAGKAEALIDGRVEKKVFRFSSPEQIESLCETLKTARELILIESKIFPEISEGVKKLLYGNLARPAGSVAVIAEDVTEIAKYSYALDYGINVISAADSGAIDALTDKYSYPAAMIEEYLRLRKLAAFIDGFFERREMLSRINNEIRGNESREEEYTKNADEIRWIRRNENTLINLKTMILNKTEGM
jgi:hypothetical protein